MREAIQGLSLLTVLAAVLVFLFVPLAWPFLVFAILFAVGTWLERFYYRGGTVAGQGGRLQPTGERFLDEESGQPITVWFNPVTGERRYVEEGATPND